MDSSGSQILGGDLLDESQPAPIPSQPRNHRGLFFRSPEEEATPSPLEAPQEPAATAGAGDAGSASDLGWSDPTGDWSDDDPTSSTGSPASERPAQLLSKRQMRETAETAVKIGTGMAHTVAAKTDAQRAVGLYLADDDDAKAIGHPLADIMHRRGDIVGGKLSPDANDFLRSLMGVAGYFAKQVQRIGVVRQIEAGAAAGEVQTLPTEA